MSNVTRGLMQGIAAVLVATNAMAADVQVRRSVEVSQQPEAVWALMGDFCSADQWDGGVLQCERVTGQGNVPGVVRVLTLRSGGTTREQLLTHDAKEHVFSYKIVESGLPVTAYVSTLQVKPTKHGARVEWRSHFTPQGVDEAAASKIVAGIYEGGLASLKATLNKQTALPSTGKAGAAP